MEIEGKGREDLRKIEEWWKGCLGLVDEKMEWFKGDCVDLEVKDEVFINYYSNFMRIYYCG